MLRLTVLNYPSIMIEQALELANFKQTKHFKSQLLSFWTIQTGYDARIIKKHSSSFYTLELM